MRLAVSLVPIMLGLVAHQTSHAARVEPGASFGAVSLLPKLTETNDYIRHTNECLAAKMAGNAALAGCGQQQADAQVSSLKDNEVAAGLPAASAGEKPAPVAPAPRVRAPVPAAVVPSEVVAGPKRNPGDGDSSPEKTGDQSETPAKTPDDQSSSGEAAALSSCQSQASDAQSACNLEDNTTYDATSGLAASCEQMKNAGYKNGSSKTTAANSCMQKYSSCYTTCHDGATHYSQGSNKATFDSYASTCAGYKDNVSALTQASSDSTNASTAGMNCDKDSSSAPSSGGGDDRQKDAQKDKDDQKNAECTANPNAEGCATAPKYADALKPTGQFGDGSATRGNADVADTSSVVVNPAAALGGAGTPGGGGAKTGTIPNNTGGGIPGTGGGAGGGGLGGALGAVANAISSAITDIEKGFLGGGGAAAAAPPPTTEPATDGPSPEQIQEQAKRNLASLQNDSLDRYMPAAKPGAIDPHPDIQPASVSLFSRISAHYRAKCDSGELFDCY